MTTKLRTTTLLLAALGFLAVAPLGMLATADGTPAVGYVYESTKANALQGSYGVATNDASTGSRDEIGGRGASGMFQWHRQVVPAWNGAQDDEGGYASCGSSCGKRAILGTATATEGVVSCTDSARWTPLADCESQDEAQTRWPLWGSSESPFTTAEQNGAMANRSAEMVTFPMSIAVISVVYNINGCANGQLQLTGALISRMYRGTQPDGITMWNHADLVALNPCLSGEATPIIPVIRSDGSGTTFAFSDFLVRSSGVACWGPKELIADCAENELSGAQNPGVADKVGVTPRSAGNYGAFGYVEKAQADVDGLKQAKIQARDGAFLLASEQGGTDAATAVAPTLPKSHGDWSAVSLAYAPGSTSYPISTFGYLMAIANPWDANGPHGDYSSLWTAAEYNALKEFLTWANEHTNVAQDFDVTNYASVGPVVGAINREGIARMNYGPRHAFDLGNDVTDAVALCGYPVEGQHVSAQPNGAFSPVEGDYVASSAGALVGATEAEGASVTVTGAIQVVGAIVTIDGVPAGRVQCNAAIDPLASGVSASGQVVDGSFLVHSIA